MDVNEEIPKKSCFFFLGGVGFGGGGGGVRVDGEWRSEVFLKIKKNFFLGGGGGGGGGSGRRGGSAGEEGGGQGRCEREVKFL